MSLVWSLIGVLNVWTGRNEVAIVQAVLSLTWIFLFNLSVGQLGWAIPAEIGSTRLRQKTICLARTTAALIGTLSGILQQYMINTNRTAGGWDLRGNAGFVWCGTALSMTIWAFFRLPETRKRSYHELNVLFAQKVPAREIASTQTDAFDEHETDRLAQQYANIVSTRHPGLVPPIDANIVRSSIGLAQRYTALVGRIVPRRPNIAGNVTSYLSRQL